MMNDLSNFLVDAVLSESNDIKRIIVVYSGRFQPFHAGHYAAYQHLVKKFGKDNVYIGTSDKTNNLTSPFNFKEKREIITRMFDIPFDKVVQVKNPYSPAEILKNFDNQDTAYIAAVGEKDSDRLGGRYFLKYTGSDNLNNYTLNGYVYTVPSSANNISATMVRMGLRSGSIDDKRHFFKTVAYPSFDSNIFDLITSKLLSTVEISEQSVFIPSNIIERWLVDNLDLIIDISGHGSPKRLSENYYPVVYGDSKFNNGITEQIGYFIIESIMSGKISDVIKYSVSSSTPFSTAIPQQFKIAANSIGNSLLKYSVAEHKNNPISMNTSENFESNTKRILSEIPMSDLVNIDYYADRQFDPYDFVLTDNHFFERLRDPRNIKPISQAELMGFIKRLSRDKQKFIDFLKRYGQVVATDNRTNINIPFMMKANRVIAKTIMRKADFKTSVSSPKFTFESTNRGLNEYSPKSITKEGVSNYYKAVITAEGFKPLPIKFERVGHGGAATTYHKITMQPLYISFDLSKMLDTEYAILHEITHQIKLETEKDAYNGKRDQLAKFKKLENRLVEKYLYSKYSNLLWNAKNETTTVGYPNQNYTDPQLKIARKSEKEFKKKIKTLESADIIRGGKSSGKTVSDIAKHHKVDVSKIMDELKRGIKIEMEHTTDKNIAREIALDHLFEDPKYYTKLKSVEEYTMYRSHIITPKRKPKITGEVNELTKGSIFAGKSKIDGERVPYVFENLTNTGMDSTPVITFLIGPPASGKSTWVSKNRKNAIVISRDDIVDKLRKPYGWSYNETFNHPEFQEKVNIELKNTIDAALSTKSDIIVDMTNMNRKSRSFILRKVPDFYTKNAVVFNVSKSELLNRLKKRREETGKDVPLDVVDRMLDSFEAPTKSEFDNIMVAENTINFSSIKTFRDLFNVLPPELQKRVYALKNIPQRLDKHPEGNVLKHTITVVNRSLKYNDIDIAIAAMFHDIGKDETGGIHPKHGYVTHYGHETVSAQLVKKYRTWIRSVGGNPASVYFIVKNHMKYKNFSDLRQIKQDRMRAFGSFDKLSKFGTIDKGGLHESVQFTLNIPSDIQQIHNAFKKAGKKLYVVGGAVRDALMGNPPKDFDLATDATPDEVLQIAADAGLKTLEVGKAFGVVIVNGNEIATFRKDIGKGRRPTAVDYTDIAGDVKRRDLTVNALFYDMDKKEIVDLVGGIEDLKNRKIRTVGKAEDRFEEDPLRKLRALRFQARMGADLDKELLNALQSNPTLDGVSFERIRDEFIKTVKSAKNTADYMNLMDKIGFTNVVFPNLKTQKPYIHTNDYVLFLASILRNNGSNLANALNKLKYTGEEVRNISFLVSLQDFTPDKVALYKRNQSKTTLSDEQIIKFGKLIGKDMTKFIRFKLSVRGTDVPKNIKGSGIGDWIDSREKELYLKESSILKKKITEGQVDPGEPETGYIPDGDVRKLGTTGTRPEYWFKQLGFTQMHFPKADAMRGKGKHADKESAFRKVVYSTKNVKISKLKKILKPVGTDEWTALVKEGLVTEGGVYGHINHPFDIELNLTFGQLKDIVNKALDGNLEFVREKTDGYALAVSWKGGKLIAARNKGHLKNGGIDAMDIGGISDKFNNRGELKNAFVYAMEDLNSAIRSLSDKQKYDIFKDGSCFMNLEIIYPNSINVIPYGQSLLVFHNLMEYDSAGNPVKENKNAAILLSKMIKEINADVQTNFKIQGPPIVSLPKNSKLTELKGKYNTMISALQSKFNLSDNDGVAEYHQAWWADWIGKNSPALLDNRILTGLVKRWALLDKSFRLDSKNINNDEVLNWAKMVDAQDHSNLLKNNIRPFENIFLGIGSDVLSFMSSVLTLNPTKASMHIKNRLDAVIRDIKNSGDTDKIQKLKFELERLNSIGGTNNIIPIEGIVFTYPPGENGHTLKLTGKFAPINKLLGIFYGNG